MCIDRVHPSALTHRNDWFCIQSENDLRLLVDPMACPRLPLCGARDDDFGAPLLDERACRLLRGCKALVELRLLELTLAPVVLEVVAR